MRLNRRTRRFAAWFAILGLLLMQVAVSAYACPELSLMAMAESDMGPDCGKMPDTDKPGLCKAQHEVQSQLKGDNAPLPPFAVPLSTVVSLITPLDTKSGQATTVGLNSYHLARLEPDGSPPLFLRLKVLRN
jgi:hypothetical protein